MKIIEELSKTSKLSWEVDIDKIDAKWDKKLKKLKLNLLKLN